LPDGAEIGLDTSSGQTMALQAGPGALFAADAARSDFPILNAGDLPVSFTAAGRGSFGG
jgi:hypothetical protein